MTTANWILNEQNFSRGFLVDESRIAGVTTLGESAEVFAAYVSDALTGETLEYHEFASAKDALAHLARVPGHWAYEGVGCKTGSATGGSDAKSCGLGKCSGGICC